MEQEEAGSASAERAARGRPDDLPAVREVPQGPVFPGHRQEETVRELAQTALPARADGLGV